MIREKDIERVKDVYGIAPEFRKKQSLPTENKIGKRKESDGNQSGGDCYIKSPTPGERCQSFQNTSTESYLPQFVTRQFDAAGLKSLTGAARS
jgi:hypothetical protein